MKTGLDRLEDEAPLRKKVAGQRVGLVAHPASVTRSLTHAEGVLRGAGARLEVVFGPEHGYGGEAQDMAAVADEAAGGLRVRSLYGATEAELSPSPSDLAGLDVVVIDLQDVGARYYTFVWTALLVARACRAAGVRVLILDRPNPLGAEVATLEGQLPEPECLSFVGLAPVPVRHGLSLGAIVALFARREGATPEELVVARALDVAPGDHAPSWDRPFVPPSPNMPTYDTALVYPGGCLVEGTNLSEGRGTTRPFELVGAPWLDGARVAQRLLATGLPGFVPRAVTFTPTFHKHAGARCGGVHVHVVDRNTFRPYATYLALLACARAEAPERFALRTEVYEFRADRPALDLLTGSARAREGLLQGADPRALADELAAPGRREQEVHEEGLLALKRYGV